MTSTSHAHALASFLPWFHLDTLSARSQALTEHRVDQVTGSVLFVDITGFSAITEQLSQAGPAGAEQLADILNSYFGRMTEIITNHGGDVLSFAGDAALGVWFDESNDLARSACLAAQAGLAIQAELKEYQATPDVFLQQRASVGAGRLYVSELGGHKGRWKYFVAGEALELAGAANEKAVPGEVVVADETWPIIQPQCQGTKTASGVYKIESVPAPLDLQPSQRPPASEMLANLAGTYLPRVVQDRVEAGQAEWLAEFRSVSLLFIGLGALDFDNSKTMTAVQQAVKLTQLIEQQYEGSILRFLMDDKGTTLILSFGLPPLAHEDDAGRAIQSGLALKKQLNEIGLNPSIGVTTGRAFCGACGMESRRQYSIYGPVINLAARLMQQAEGRLLCDVNTFDAASKTDARLTFKALPKVSLKGFAKAVAMFEPGETQTETGPKRQTQSTQSSVVGRVHEQQLLASAIADLANDRTGRGFVVEGDAGIGKSQLTTAAMAEAGQTGLRCLVATADEIEKTTSFYAWRSVIREVLDIDMTLDLESNRNSVLTKLSRWPDLLPLASLLNVLLPFDIAESAIVGAMTDEARAENRQSILFQLMEDWCTQHPAMIVVDDAQWLDSTSWECLLRLAESGKLLLVVATRPIDPDSVGFQSFLALSEVTHLKLENLSPAEVATLVCERLGVESIPDRVAQLIVEKAGGHPLFSEELAYMLRDVGLIQIADGKCRLVVAESETGQHLAERLENKELPSTVQGVVMRRLDRLPPEQLLTIKVASVIGQNFGLATLLDVFPVEIPEDRLRQDLAELVRLDIAEWETASAEPTYRFKHAITLDVAYESLLFAQRRTLHEAVARWHERVHANELPRHYPALAYHWQRAEDVPKAVDYLAKSGEQALSSFANQEAVRFISDALVLTERSGESVERIEQATWECRLGRAYVNWSKYSEGREHLEKGLVLFGYSVPKGAAAYMGLGSQVMRQFYHRLIPWRRFVRNPERDLNLREAACAYEALMIIYFAEDATEQSLYSALKSLNLAEAGGPSAELARGYGAMGALVGIMGMRKSADRYLERAMNTARDVGNQSAEAWVALSAGVYKAGLGDWAQAVPMLQRVMTISERLRDRRRWEDGSIHMAFALFLQGDISSCLSLAEDIHSSTLRTDDDRGRAIALSIRGFCLLVLNRLDSISKVIDEFSELRKDTWEVAQANLNILMAGVHWQKGELEQAREKVGLFLDRLNESSMTYESLPGHATAANIVLHLLETDQTGGNDELARQATTLCRHLRKQARFFPVGRSATELAEGLRLWNLGRQDKAHQKWRRSLEHAQSRGMRYSEARSHYQIGRHLERHDPAREIHLNQAHGLFAEMGAEFDRQNAERELKVD